MKKPTRGDPARGLVRVERVKSGPHGYAVHTDDGGGMLELATFWEKETADRVANDIRKCIRYAVNRARREGERGRR